MNILIIDALAANDGHRLFTRDVIGAGPKLLAGIVKTSQSYPIIVRVEDLLNSSHSHTLSSFDGFLISAMSVDLVAVKKVIAILRSFSAPIILGGPILADSSLLFSLDINAGVIGEGEWILQDLLSKQLNFASLSNTEYYTTRRIKNKFLFSSIKNPSTADPLEHFFPDTAGIRDYPDYWFSRVYVEVVRGCSNHFRGDIVKSIGGCSECGNCESPETVSTDECPEDIPSGCGFCSVPTLFGPPRSRPLKLILDEVESLFSQGVKRIVLSAPGFLDYKRGDNKTIYSPTVPSPNLSAIEKLLATLAKIRDSQSHKCSIAIENVKPSLVTPEAAQILGKYLANTPISVGCETFDQKHSRDLGRPDDPKSVIRAASLLSNAELKPQIYLIHSLPGETVRSLRRTREVIEHKLPSIADKITVYKYLPLPNSPFTKLNVPSPSDRYLMEKERGKLKNTIIAFNKKKKGELVGKQFYTVVAEKDRVRDNTYIAYPLFGGPAVSIESSTDLREKVLKIEIVNIISDKLVLGKIVK